MSPPAKKKARGDGHERYLEIIGAARQVFNEHGYRHTTMRRLAEQSGISVAAIYIYFDSKEAILAAIRDQAFLELNRATQRAVALAKDPEERLRAHLRAYLDFARSDPEGYRLTFRSQLIFAPRPGRPAEAGKAPGLEAFKILVDEVAALISPEPDHRSQENDAHVWAEAAWAAIHGLSSLVIDVPNFPASGLDASFDALVTMVISGIRARPTK
ncbi:TetR/AcrR family transcriptional regulator [Rhizorhabdus dicambivorans]|uniref:TetR family transcriptional regulator n=1 Tax=Rhizorhabdus dicambivorans TaxID=1850238 RepID=A0A2A4FTF6_9SPHN|nr:TetR/AcrR family transcriptional regulator [Rhizorhabdus dicambivorans]ATE63837.1 TetR family transcriptional regulator [Rhizorhabdus dicambivorans]PCE40671.1 TetR family transcriptional regulator [Rhizorhabdus dicambivorans]